MITVTIKQPGERERTVFCPKDNDAKLLIVAFLEDPDVREITFDVRKT